MDRTPPPPPPTLVLLALGLEFQRGLSRLPKVTYLYIIYNIYSVVSFVLVHKSSESENSTQDEASEEAA